MLFEVEVEKTAAGEWVATAIGYDVKATGLSEKEALGRMMEALALHFKKAAKTRPAR